MTAEEWKRVEETLSTPYGGIVRLKIDGYNVAISHALIEPLKYGLAIYIDDVFKGKWIMEDCDIRRRFLQKHTKSLLKAKEKKALMRQRKAFREQIMKDMTFEWYSPYWSSFRCLKSHLIKNNKSIELVE